MASNLFDYLKWRGDLNFSYSPLNPVDFLIFSQISYLPFDGIVPDPEDKKGINMHLALKELLEKNLVKKSCRTAKTYDSAWNFKEDPDFIKALLSSGRYGNCYLLGYENQLDDKIEKQFSAICVYTGDLNIVVFRGTDASLVGWKEDFNMSFKKIVPAQLEAVNYLNKMADRFKSEICLAGHSKGGNLAIYSAAFCKKKIQKNITDIYSFDAPGFHESIISSDNYTQIKDKIRLYIPQSSVVGMMMEHGCNYTVVKSSETGFTQHILYTWEVTKNDLVHLEEIDHKSRFVDKTLREWVNGLNNDEREQFIDTVYKILLSTEVKTVHEMEKSWLLALGKMFKSIGKMDEENRKAAIKTIIGLFRSAKNNLNTLFKKEKS